MMTNKQISASVATFESFGLDSETVMDMVREVVAESYELGQKALIHFGAIDSPVIGAESSEYHETPDLIGEVYSDYEEVMEEFHAFCV